LFTTGGTHQPPLVNRNGLVFLGPKSGKNRGKSGKIGYFFVFFGPRGPKSGFREKDDERVTNLGVGKWGTFYCEKKGVGNLGCVFHCEEIGGGFFWTNLVKSGNRLK